MSRVVVLGSSNTDLVLRVPRLPAPGETVLGHEFAITAGGKGANQAVAAARAGGHVSFVASIGNDDFGRARLAELADLGVDVSHVRTIRGSSSGIALILVDELGRNLIGVAPGANSSITPQDIESLSDRLFHPGSTLVAQLETPPATVRRALELARGYGMRTILNPAPLDLCVASQEWLTNVDILIVNEHELAQLVDEDVNTESPEANQALLARLHALGVSAIVVTLGAQGHLLSLKGGVEQFPAFEVQAVDTVGAGDTFVGALAACWTDGTNLQESTHWASAAAALSVTRRGAVGSIPTKDEVERFLKLRESTNAESAS